MDPVTEPELLNVFNGQLPAEAIPDLNKVEWEAHDFLGWVHPAGHLAYMLLLSPKDGYLKGIEFRRFRFSGNGRGIHMCSLCHHMHPGEGTAVFSVSRKGSGGRHRLGNVVCKDLDCSLRIRDLVSPNDYYQEKLNVEAKIWRMQTRIHRWLNRAERL